MSAFISRSLISRSSAILNSARRLVNHQQRRFLDLQEYQSKKILHEHQINVQRFKVAKTETEVIQVFSEIGDYEEFVIKAQVLAGGRGKGTFKNSSLQGGVLLTENPVDACRFATTMLNDYIITKQTTKSGVLVEKVMIAEAVRLKREFYFAIVLDRSFDTGAILVTSPDGGMDIEEIAAKDEGAVRKFTIPIDVELDFETAQKISLAAFDLNTHETHIIDQCADQIIKLHKLFLKLDATQIEINPLGVTNKLEVICVDAKINFDENARFRQKWLDELEEMNKNETDIREYEARKSNLNYIAMDGNIGCLVNGAGLAMATMDIIKLHGGNPANFLDVGGGATTQQVTEALRIISSDPNVRAILVNIFGGIVRCDIIAQGIVEAAESLNARIPIICRLQGTRMEDAQAIIAAHSKQILIRNDLDEAASLAVSVC